MIEIKEKDLKERMIKQGYTQSKLAQETGISQSYIVMLLSGKRSMLPPTAKKIYEALDCNFDDIFIIKQKI